MNSKLFHELNKHRYIRWRLVFYDMLIFTAVSALFLLLHPSSDVNVPLYEGVRAVLIILMFTFIYRTVFNVYGQIWRYGGLGPYMSMFMADILACISCMLLMKVFSLAHVRIILIFSIFASSLLLCIFMRFCYAIMYEYASKNGEVLGKGVFSKLIQLIGGINLRNESGSRSASRKIRVAIVGAGRLGVSLAEDMLSSSSSMYLPVCFFDIDKMKYGRTLMGLPVYNDGNVSEALISVMDIQEIILALPNTSSERRKELYDFYKPYGCRVRVYDYPITSEIGSGKLQVRDFDIEELLLRRQIVLDRSAIDSYYHGKTVLVTGGGGSIGSELCRQVALSNPARLIVLDIAENTTYSLQQGLKYDFGDKLELNIEICSVRDRSALWKVFDTYRPQVVLHAAAHKHVPLMEHNCVQAVKNNVFGTKNVVDMCEEFGVEKLVLVSSDKAVNPTNVMGATKRMCEMLVLRHSFACAVRFGNVMGSAGSVIPLFKAQIKRGGPVTITDKRIIRYFMTIPEASRLILESGAKAKSGELFVLDMGEPVSIYKLAEDMIRLSGLIPGEDIEIVETGLRPGEKLYEELLMKSETLSKTDNELIFVEKQEPLSGEELDGKLALLADAVETEDNEAVVSALKATVPTYRSPEEVNKQFVSDR